jgi:hypothetical protein
MAFVPGENVALVELRMLLDNQQVENTLYIQNDSAWDTSSLTGLVSNMRDWWSADYSNLCSNQCSLSEVVATDLTTDTSGQAAIAGGGLNGIQTAARVANNVTATVSFRTGGRGRSLRGRNYICGLTTFAFDDANHLTEDFVADMIAEYTNIMTAILPAGQTWGVFSRFSGGVPRVAGLFTPITTVVVVDNIADSQRRRLPGRGR